MCDCWRMFSSVKSAQKWKGTVRCSILTACCKSEDKESTIRFRVGFQIAILVFEMDLELSQSLKLEVDGFESPLGIAEISER